MDVKLYDTLTREKRPFSPLDPTNVRMYVCGPTVYDFPHIGNARPVIVFDVLFRLLRHLYGPKHVKYVRNITDVDDKINARAAEEYPDLPLNEGIRRVTQQTELQFHQDVEALGCLPPTEEPRATEHIAEMKVLIECLIGAGCAYVAEEHVLFHVLSAPDYGKLGKRSTDEMIEGARVEVAPHKRDPMDFVLWKPSRPGEPAWPSPAGIQAPGRPGWHIECSAMSWRHLGETFDIHGGGIDLVFPHHENEIAQSRCAFHTPFMARTWMHNGFLQVEGEKMSKSLGNFVTIRELLADWPGEVIRLNMLKTHYRHPIDWTLNSMKVSHQIWSHWRNIVAEIDPRSAAANPSRSVANALMDDLNTPEVMFSLHGLASASHQPNVHEELYSNLLFMGLIPDQLQLSEDAAKKITEAVPLPENLDRETIKPFIPKIEAELDRISSTLTSSANTTTIVGTTIAIISPFIDSGEVLGAWTKYHVPLLSSEEKRHVNDKIGIAQLNERIERRLEARRVKDFKEADRIRDELTAMGIVLKDTKDGTTTWEVAR
jgi:cysteinyl-tRNA synthetase